MKRKAVFLCAALAVMLYAQSAFAAGVCADWVGQWVYTYAGGDNQTVLINQLCVGTDECGSLARSCVANGKRVSDGQPIAMVTSPYSLTGNWAYYESDNSFDQNTVFDAISPPENFTGTMFDNVTAGEPTPIFPAPTILDFTLTAGRKTGSITPGVCGDLLGTWAVKYYDTSTPAEKDEISDTLTIESVCESLIPGPCQTYNPVNDNFDDWACLALGHRASDDHPVLFGKLLQDPPPTSYQYLESFTPNPYFMGDPAATILDTYFTPQVFLTDGPSFTDSVMNLVVGTKMPSCIDADGDTYGVGCTAGPDCDDTNSAVHPGATEVCNGIDDNCNGTTDEGCGIWYRDADGDTYGNPSVTTVSIGKPTGYVANNTDCDDTNSAIYVLRTGYRDADMDTYTTGGAVQVCSGASLPSGWRAAANGNDCDDSNSAKWANKNGYLDTDGDTYGAGTVVAVCSGATLLPPYRTKGGDCDETNSNINPGVTENSSNGIDDNCNGVTDEAGPLSDLLGRWEITRDNGTIDVVNITTVCLNYDNCGGEINPKFPSQTPMFPAGTVVGTREKDGMIVHLGTFSYLPAAWMYIEGPIAEWAAGDSSRYTQILKTLTFPCSFTQTGYDYFGINTGRKGHTYYRDADGDGYGNAAVTTFACTLPSGYVAVSGDCDDTSATKHLVDPDLTAPSGAGIVPLPSFTWQNKSPGTAPWYEVSVYSATSGMYIANEWFEAASVCSGGSCTTHLSAALPPGTFYWWLNTYGANSCGLQIQPGGKYKQFTVSGCGGPTLTAPTGTVASGARPAHTFTSNAEWVDLQIYSSTLGAVSSQWVDAASACTMSSCSVTPVRWIMALGQNWWWVNTWSAACGYQFQPGGNLGTYTIAP